MIDKEKKKGKYHHVVDTMDGVIDEWWDDMALYQPPTFEERAKELGLKE
jgi:hypothetical protein